MKESIKKNKMYVNGLLSVIALLVVLFMYSCKTFESQFQLISDEDIETTKSNCSNLLIPDSFVKVRDSELAKSGQAVFTTQYTSSVDPKTVDEHFYNQIVPHGWEYTSRKEGGDTFLYFDKGKFSIIIHYGIIGFSSNRLYGVSCTWGPSRKGLFGELLGE